MPQLQINKGIYSYLLSFIAGLSLVLCYAPFSLWPVSIASILLWFSQLDKRQPKQAFYQGLSFGFGWFAAGISWVHVSLSQFGGMPLIATIMLMLLLCLYLALYPALAAFCCAKLAKSKQLNLYFLPFLWVITEFLRSKMLTGFPWLSLGYSQIDGPLAVLAPIIGEVGISFVILLSLVAVFKLFQGQRLANGIILLTILLITIYAGKQQYIETTGKQVNVALVQGNIKQELRWDEDQEQKIIDRYINMTEPLYKDHDIILWPEAAIPRLEPLALESLHYLDKSANDSNTALITGVINYDPDSRSFFNRLVVLGKKYRSDEQGDYYYRNSNHYDKHHLLPIGEFVPFAELLRPIAPLFNLPMSSFSRGDYVQKNIIANDLHIASLICFEIVFAKQFAASINANTNLLLTVSNDAWFGDSHGPHQHLDIARMRALEFGRPMLRATNNGVTAVITHKGEINKVIPQFETTTLSTKVDLVTGTTPYAKVAQFIDYILMSLFIVFIIGKLIYQRMRS